MTVVNANPFVVQSHKLISFYFVPSIFSAKYANDVLMQAIRAHRPHYTSGLYHRYVLNVVPLEITLEPSDLLHNCCLGDPIFILWLAQIQQSAQQAPNIQTRPR